MTCIFLSFLSTDSSRLVKSDDDTEALDVSVPYVLDDPPTLKVTSPVDTSSARAHVTLLELVPDAL